MLPWLGEGVGNQEGIAVRGRPECAYHQARRGWNAGGGDLLQGGNQPGDLLRLGKKYAGMMPSEMKRLRKLEQDNARLKKIVADLTLDREMMQDVIKRKI